MTLLVGSIFHMTRKIVSEMTYNVSMGTLNPTIPILRYSKLFVENCHIFIPHLCLAAPRGVTRSEFREDQDLREEYTQTRMNGLSCGEEIMTIYSAVLIQYQRMTDGRTAYIYYVLQHS